MARRTRTTHPAIQLPSEPPSVDGPTIAGDQRGAPSSPGGRHGTQTNSGGGAGTRQDLPWVLVVDDDDLHGPMVHRQLTLLGMCSTVVEHGDEAVELLEGHKKPLLAIIDRDFDCGTQAAPDSGEAAERHGVPILYLAANLSQSREPEPGAPAVLAKPFSVEDLSRFIDRALLTAAAELRRLVHGGKAEPDATPVRKPMLHIVR